jgi:hypothetical protein
MGMKNDRGRWTRQSIANDRAYQRRLDELIASLTNADGRLSPWVTLDQLKQEARNPTTHVVQGEDREPTSDGWF